MPALGLALGLPFTRPSGSSFTGPLDAYTSGMVGAYSVIRRLLASYEGPLVRLRRSSDNEEQDIGATATGELDTAAIASFVGANSAFVAKVYNQTGSNDYTQSTAALQPRIVNSGTLDTNEGQPAIFNISASDTYLGTSSFSVRTWIVSAQQTAGLFYAGLLTGTSTIVLIGASGAEAFTPTVGNYAYYVNGVDETSDLTPWCLSTTRVLSLTGDAANNGWLWGSERGLGGRFFPGYFQEQVLFSDVSANRAAVETAMMEVLSL